MTSGREVAGGLLGYGDVNSSVVASYALGDVSAPELAGGLVGANSNIEASYSTGLVLSGGAAGGLISQAEGFSVLSSYWATDASGQLDSAAGVGVT